MPLVRLIALIACVSSMATGCASSPALAPATYVVQPRDTLYSIAWRHDLDYRDLARWNHIGPDYRISVGQVLVLKTGNTRAPEAGPRAAPAPRGAVREPSAVSPGSAPENVEAARQGCGWTWPTTFKAAPRPVPGGGVLLLGTLGQPIRAACAGRVVYAGNGIRGYGNLIIIKHGETMLSAYAHTAQLEVHEGEDVAAGQEIARMGTGAHDIAALYFEIRLNGKPVDPLPFLPLAK